MVQLLLNNGADINSSEKNSVSPLYIACYNRHDSTVKLLLSNGANDNPLHVARGRGYESPIQLSLPYAGIKFK